MHLFQSCTQRKPVQLSLDDEEQVHEHSLSGCLCNCFPFRLHKRGTIRLPADPDEATFLDQDDLFAEDSADDASEFNRSMFNEPHRFLSRNPFAAVQKQDLFPEELEDAQFLSDHRISAVIGESSKIYRPPSVEESFGEELISVGDRQAATYLTDWTDQDQPEPPRALPRSSHHHLLDHDYRDDDQVSIKNDHQFPQAHISPNSDPTLQNTLSQDEKAEDFSETRGDAPTTQSPVTDPPIDAVDAADPSPTTPYTYQDDDDDDDDDNHNHNHNQNLNTNDNNDTDKPFPVSPLTTPDELPTAATADTQPLDSVKPNPDASPLDVSSKRSSTVAVVAQSILGDRLEDFTEKLAFIRKNIIMSLEDEEDSDREEAVQRSQTPPRRRSSHDPLRSLFNTSEHKADKDSQDTSPNRHKRSSSFMEVAGPALSRLMNQIGGNTDNHPNFSPSSFFATLAGPDVHAEKKARDEEANDKFIQQQQRQLSRSHSQRLQSTTKTFRASPLPEVFSDEEDDGEEEELFDFTKVIEMGKNVRVFSEDVVGSGLRIFNNVATKVRNASKQLEEHEIGTGSDRQHDG